MDSSIGDLFKKHINFNVKGIILCIVLSVMITLVLMAVRPSSFRNPVQVTATGQVSTNNAVNYSSEVWILGVSTNGIEIALSSLILTKGWEYRDYYNGAILSLENQPATLELNLPPGLVNIIFNQHAWSGTVSVNNSDKDYVVDLFMHEPYTTTISLQISNLNNFNVLLAFYLSFLAPLIIYGFLAKRKKLTSV